MRQHYGPANIESSGKFREIGGFGDPKWEQYLKKTRIRGGAVDFSVFRTWQKFKNGERIPLSEAQEFVRKAYPLDPYDPAKPFARELRINIADRLGLTAKQGLNRLKFYSALNSPLDRWWGTDALFVYDDPDVGEIEISIDETENPTKIQGGDARVDIIMHSIIAEPEDKKFMESVRFWAENIADIITRKREEKLARRDKKKH